MFKKFAVHRVLSSAFLVSFLLVVGGWLWTAVSLRGIAQPLILHFSSSVGITETGGLANLAMMGGISIVIIIINFFLSFELVERDWFLSTLIAGTTLFLSVLIFIGFRVIMSVN